MYIDVIIVTKILEFRTKNGKFLTIAELRFVDGIDDDTFDKQLNFTFHQSQNRKVNAVLSNNFGFGGHNASIIFKRYQ